MFLLMFVVMFLLGVFVQGSLSNGSLSCWFLSGEVSVWGSLWKRDPCERGFSEKWDYVKRMVSVKDCSGHYVSYKNSCLYMAVYVLRTLSTCSNNDLHIME